MYLLLLATVALWLIWVLVSGSSLKYRSDMQQITPDIVTPCADGQGQYGTAKWMPKSKYRTYFTVRRSKNMNIDDLLEAGRQDKEALNAKKLPLGGKLSSICETDRGPKPPPLQTGVGGSLYFT